MSEQIKKSVLAEMQKELVILENQYREAATELEKLSAAKKKIFSGLMNEVHSLILEIEKKSVKNLNLIEKSSKYLLEVIDGDYDISYTEFDDTPHDLKKSLQDFEASMKEYYQEIDERTKNSRKKFEEEVTAAIDDFREETDPLNCPDMHDSDLAMWKKGKVRSKEVIRQKIDQKLLQSKIKMAKFQVEIDEAYETLRTAFQELK